MDKRDFLKQCFCGICGVAVGYPIIDKFFWGDKITGLYRPAMWELWRWSKEAMFYTKVAGGVQCQKCPHECVLAEGDEGFCKNRVNYKGKLYSIAYGNPCAIHIDPIEKKPLFHFLPSKRAFSIAAAGCNFRCLNCQNWQISQFSPKETENYDYMPDKILEQCIATQCESMAYTYSEPTSFYEYVYDTALLAKNKGIKNILKSNGYINEEPLRKLCKVLDAANIDLKCYDDVIYKKIAEGSLAPVLKTLAVLRGEGVWLEITNLVIPQWTDDLEMIKRMCGWIVTNKLHDAPLHFSRFTPLYKLTQLPLTPVSTLEKAREIARSEGIEYVYIGNVPAHAAENTYCHKCGKLLIERRGFAILKNELKNGACSSCGTKIPGVWK
jgi:pyruvate formate lyase activating enzyme